MLDKEVWKDIIWYEWIYKISNLWNVKSLYSHNWTCERILKPENSRWYKRVLLRKNKINKKFSIHRLVAIAFINNYDNKKNIINHKNWIKSDNRIENLEWCTLSENTKHSYDILHRVPTCLWRTWLLSNSYKIVWKFKNWILLQKYFWTKEAWRYNNICYQNISACCNW
jgi:hypothetical protein